MEDTIQQPYRDSPASSRSSSPTSGGRIPPPKPLPSLPTDAPPSFEETYRDEPSPFHIAAPHPQRYRPTSEVLSRQAQHVTPYTDIPEGDDDDVPLAHLYPYPTEAPPAYHIVVRQSYRDTLISHIPPNFTGLPEADEEAGVERPQADDVRFSVERVVAGLIVSMVLVLITTLLVWHILSIYFNF
ncbi:hypothetical protein K505DRAFT_336111 [Melanomma pulvis-pyrius CBS 109.77]|uniref:Uncharacterized protein n=1 Tax=Melanomma pulvis-pyrius CBS 109.77 TaxID=1314802 RepID=A0A6A6XHJ0_9PLEO|nr:hypothetical protein K505DRAFT_336111 [Melanomma pulvis-pyrius CBS 109.77]